ncbi:hypothetical protein VTH8203_01510 [Vibrio thalassae]|uniref:Lipoprotein n=1 Tax=Vibrio thalassae TaxID=1243014 RepID=A0A240EIW1_9VIBR|nr:hypothetical protein [Vibrio thalassae]SNX47895.1 hypothetical protein VTH8203_01510 [Vibrio thalassae]
MVHFKELYCVLMLTLLVGCGGGSSGSSSSSANSEDSVTRYSSDYAVSDLQAFFNLSATSSSEAEVTGYVLGNDDLYVTLADGDELVVTVDNVPQPLLLSKDEVVEGSGSYGGEYYAATTSALATEYKVSFVRGGVEISQLTANELPLPFDPIVSLTNEVVDVSFSPEAGYTYSYSGEQLSCSNGVETNVRIVAPDINNGEHLLNSGSYNKTLNEIFGQTQAQLTQGFDSCIFEMDIIASKDSLPPQTNGQLTLDVAQKRKIKIEL